VSSLLAELIRNRTGRGLSAARCVALFALFGATLTALAALVTIRWGSPWRSPRVARAALVALSIGGSMAWWWINTAVEGPTLLTLDRNHGVTSGDLLVVPALLFAASLVAVEAAPRVRRAHL
jgi:hypothetical protein